MIKPLDFVKVTIIGPWTKLPHVCYGQVREVNTDLKMAIVDFTNDVRELPFKELTVQTFEEQQKEIRLINLTNNLTYGPYSQYKNKASIGCVSFYLNGYGCRWYDTVTIGNGEVHLWGNLIARFTWRGTIPIFDWQKVLGRDRDLNNMIALWAENQELWLSHIFDSADWIFERSSGYPGFRCQKCATWVYADKEKVCNCK